MKGENNLIRTVCLASCGKGEMYGFLLENIVDLREMMCDVACGWEVSLVVMMFCASFLY